MTINGYVAPVPVRMRATPNITPFTYRDGLSYLQVLEGLRQWLNDEVIPALNNDIPGEIDRLEQLILSLTKDLQEQIDGNDVDIAAINIRIDDLEALVQSIIDNSIEAQDTVVAALVRDALSETRAALDERYMVRGEFAVNVLDEGVVGDGVANDTAALQAVIDGAEYGAHLTAPPGTRILTDGVTVEGKSIHFDFENVTLVKNANESVITAIGEWSDIQSASSVEDSSTSPQSIVAVADSTAYPAGSVVKVFSNDENTYARNPDDGSYAHLGEFATVVGRNDDEGWLRISPRLIHTYTTQIRVARMVDHPVTIRVGGGDYTAAGDPGPGFGSPPFISTEALYRATIDVDIDRSPVALVYRKSNYQDSVKAVSRYAPSDIGYVVNNQNSVGGTIYALSSRCRHTYTDNAVMVVASANPSDYGRPMYDVVTTMNIGSSYPAGGADTHHGGYGHKFINCQAVGSSGNAIDSGGAFSMRGMNHELINCSATDVGVGFNFWAEANRDYVPPMGGHVMIGCTTKQADIPINFQKESWEYVSNQAMDDVYIDGGVFESRMAESVFVNARISFNNPTFIMNTPDGIGRPSSGHGHHCLTHSGGGGFYGEVTVDVRSIQGGTFNRVVAFKSTQPTSNNELDINLRLSDWVRDNGLELIGWGGNRGSVRVNVTGSMGALETSTDFTRFAPEQSVTVEQRGNSVDVPLSNGSKVISLGAETDRIVIHSADPVVTARVTLGTLPWTPVDVTPGAFPGQVLVINNRYTSEASIVLDNTVEGISVGSGVDIAPSLSRQFIWDMDTGGTGRWVRA